MKRVSLALAFACLWSINAFAASIVLFATGQSNFDLNPAYAWSPNANAKVWNGGREGSVGTAFVPLDATMINPPSRMASAIADANPGIAVYLINVSAGGQSISHWLPGTASFDMYQNVLDNVAPALASIGATKIDYFTWWQGENDVYANTHYASDWETVNTRLKGNAWFTPAKTMIFSIAPSAVAGVAQNDAMNIILQNIANTDASRSFVPSYILPASPNWNSSLPGHMTGAGYDAAGKLAIDLLNDNDTDWAPYTPIIAAGSGPLPGATGTGKFRLLKGKTVLFTAQASNISGGTGHLKIYAPFQPAPVWSAMAGFDANSGAVLSTMVHGGFDPVAIHVLSGSGGYPSGAPVITGFCERR